MIEEQFKLELVVLILDKCNCNVAVLQCSGSYIMKNFPIFSDDLFSKRKKNKIKIYPMFMAQIPQKIVIDRHRMGRQNTFMVGK